MTQKHIALIALALVALIAGAVTAETTISVQISGPGAVDENTIKAGEPVSVDIYWANEDDDLRGFTTGFKLVSEDIKSVVHVADSGTTVAEGGDVKAYNGFGGSEAWDFTGLRIVPVNWDGELPEVIGFGGLRVKNRYGPHENKKVLSFTMMVPTPGEISIDSSFFRPGGIWAVVSSEQEEIPPVWKGPYTFKVVE